MRNPRALLENLRGSLLVAPGLSVLVAVGAALVLTQPRWGALDGESPFFGGGPASAQGLLQAITTAVITATSLTFSLTIVTLQLASSQFSPRLLRGFIRDRGTKTVLSIMLATAAYSLMVLRSIRTADDAGGEFVPGVAVSGAVVLALLSIGALVYFIDHVTTEIRVDTMLQRARDTTCTTIDRVYPADGDDKGPDASPVESRDAGTVPADSSGFVQAVDLQSLAELATTHGVVIEVKPRVGDPVVEGTPVAAIIPLTEDVAVSTESLEGGVNNALTVGFERTSAQDVAFGFRQLTDVASRALSPGINDPTTAQHAVAHLTHLLCLLAPRPMGDAYGRDPKARVRAILPRFPFEELLDEAVTPLRVYGAGHPAVVGSVLQALQKVHAQCSEPERQRAVQRQARRILAAAEDRLDDPTDLDRLRTLAHAVEDGPA